MAPAANSVAIRGALLLVLLVGALVSTAEATRNPGLGAGSVAAAPVASVHPSSFVGCLVGCAMQAVNCGIACMNRPILEGPECGLRCAADDAKCNVACGAPAPPAPGPAAQA